MSQYEGGYKIFLGSLFMSIIYVDTYKKISL